MNLFALTLVVAGTLTAPAVPDAARLRARAALALAAAGGVPGDYPQKYGQAVKAGKPLLVWVGQPARCLPGCVCHEAATFPGVTGPAVVVGRPTGGTELRRIDLPGRPDDGTIRAALAAVPVASAPLAVRPATP